MQTTKRAMQAVLGPAVSHVNRSLLAKVPYAMNSHQIDNVRLIFLQC